MRDFQKLKSLDDFSTLDAPLPVDVDSPEPPPGWLPEQQMILRMLVRPKYGGFRVPQELAWLSHLILRLSDYDENLTGIKDSWCYVTVRHGPVVTTSDAEWHFDGASFRTDLIPERNYVWVNHTPPQYKVGNLRFPEGFDPVRQDLFSWAKSALAGSPIQEAVAKQWCLMTPFCLHRRNPVTPPGSRTFIRVSFPDIEARDINNTLNPLLPTPAYGRDPVRTFRDKLEVYR